MEGGKKQKDSKEKKPTNNDNARKDSKCCNLKSIHPSLTYSLSYFHTEIKLRWRNALCLNVTFPHEIIETIISALTKKYSAMFILTP